MSAQTLACAMRREPLSCCRLALFYAFRAVMARRRRARAAPQNQLILLANRAEARVRRERVGHPLSAPNICCTPAFGGDADLGLGCRPPRVFALWSAPLSTAPGEHMSLRVADMHDWRSTSWGLQRRRPVLAVAGLPLEQPRPALGCSCDIRARSAQRAPGRRSTKLATAWSTCARHARFRPMRPA